MSSFRWTAPKPEEQRTRCTSRPLGPRISRPFVNPDLQQSRSSEKAPLDAAVSLCPSANRPALGLAARRLDKRALARARDRISSFSGTQRESCDAKPTSFIFASFKESMRIHKRSAGCRRFCCPNSSLQDHRGQALRNTAKQGKGRAWGVYSNLSLSEEPKPSRTRRRRCVALGKGLDRSTEQAIFMGSTGYLQRSSVITTLLFADSPASTVNASQRWNPRYTFGKVNRAQE
ncbi:hypothetical protein C8R47DRAFT_530520 [Mycena vitilis]|nr:hypothetical protein C8R47DRAFT_530520 [Mycena vitilis]